jgi:hypothetical protein
MSDRIKGKLAIRNGIWFGVLEVDDGWRVWVRVTSAASTPLMKDVLFCYQVARWYFGAGILGALEEFGIRENGIEYKKVAFPNGAMKAVV